jgi:molybdenum-dependent DNA-binding transcriptional regulator ModE
MTCRGRLSVRRALSDQAAEACPPCPDALNGIVLLGIWVKPPHKSNRKIFDPDIEPLYILPMIDLNLIRAFVTIYETRSVSVAADRLHVSQPSISYTLKRLRDLLGEPLFKRTREGMAPTYFATQLYEKFRSAVSEIEGAIESTRKFDPYLSSRRMWTQQA